MDGWRAAVTLVATPAQAMAAPQERLRMAAPPARRYGSTRRGPAAWRGRHAGGSRRRDTPRNGDVPRHADGSRQAGQAGLPRFLLVTPPAAAAGEIEEVGRWLEEFHPRALVELDYGGLVHMLDDGALRADQSVAEVAAAITGLETGELELAVAMYQRLRNRWRALHAAETAS